MESQNILTCPSCGNVSSTASQDLSLGIPFTRSRALIELVREPEVFGPDSVDDVVCDSEACRLKSSRPRTKLISLGPEVLVVQIRRFSFDPRTQKARKKNHFIPIQAQLDLSDFYSPGTLKYGLFSVIHHSGSLTGGHYVSVAEAPSKQWHWLNDSRVTISSLNAALQSTPEFKPYLLFYARMRGANNQLSTISQGSGQENLPRIRARNSSAPLESESSLKAGLTSGKANNLSTGQKSDKPLQNGEGSKPNEAKLDEPAEPSEALNINKPEAQEPTKPELTPKSDTSLIPGKLGMFSKPELTSNLPNNSFSKSPPHDPSTPTPSPSKEPCKRL